VKFTISEMKADIEYEMEEKICGAMMGGQEPLTCITIAYAVL